MAQQRSGPSMAALIQRHARTRFVGRGGELAAFRANFDIPHDDPGHRFLFHLHGNAGVGKTYLVRAMRAAAEERGALTAYVDESVGSVPEALASISEQFARKGRPLTRLDRMLATYRERRHEAALASLPGDVAAPAGPSAGGRAVAVASLVGLGAVPGLGALTGVVDAGQLAGAADQVWASLSSRFRNPDDVRLVLAPEQVLTPVLTRELAEAAAEVPWIALFFDTYERTAPFLDSWLRDLMTTEEYGGLTPRAVVTVAGQRPFDSDCWGGRPYFVADLRLEPFTEGEARELLAAKQVTDEGVVTEILRLSRGLPVLVSTLAENQPTDPDDVGDPSATAVERFLKWERDPVRRSAALACALPRRLNEDIFLAVVGEQAAGLYGWLCDLPFATPKDGGIGYHDVVRVPMLRLQRGRSPHRWRERHAALAGTFAGWRAETEADLRPDKLWESAAWRALRLEETYHELCASPRAALPGALATVVDACREGRTAARRCARALAEAGEDTDDQEVRDWGLRLRAALSGAGGTDAGAGGGAGGGIRAALGLLIDGTGLDTAGRAAAHEVRGRELYNARENEAALAEYDRSLALDPCGYLAYAGRGVNHVELHDHAAAVADLRRADELAPGTPWVLGWYAEALRRSGRVGEAVGVLDRALALDPANAFLLACRGVCRHLLGAHPEALADFDRALELDGDYLWALVRRGRLLRATGRDERGFADLDRAVEIAPDSDWIASERGDAYRVAGRYADAERELGRALSLRPDHASALAGRGEVRYRLGRHTEALADFDRAVALRPAYVWALTHRAAVNRALRRHRASLADADRALELGSQGAWAYEQRALTALAMGRVSSALADLERGTALTDQPGVPLHAAARAHLLAGAPEAALGALDRLTEASGGDESGGGPGGASGGASAAGVRQLRCDALRRAGRTAEALAAAERLRVTNPLRGAFAHALAVTAADGAGAAEPAWREVAERLAAVDFGAGKRAFWSVTCAAALGDRALLDASLDTVLAAGCDWDELAELAGYLTELSAAPGPGTDTATAAAEHLAPALARLTDARDATAARWA